MKYILLLVLLAGCQSVKGPEPITDNMPDKPVKIEASYDWDHKSDSKNWTEFTRKALLKRGKNLLNKKSDPASAGRYCDRFNEMNKEERIVFWTGLIAAMARYESSFRPSTTFKESFKNSKGERVISAGLLQASYESARGYGFKDATTEKLKDPEYNLNVGVQILERWFGAHAHIATKVDGKWRGGAKYWSVLRPRTNSKVYKIRKVTKAMAVCKKKTTPFLPLTSVKYGKHSKAFADYFVAKCLKRVSSPKLCKEMVSPNTSSKGSFRAVYGSSTPHILMPKENKFEVGIRLLEMIERAQKIDSKIKVCQIANWYRPEPYNSRVGGAKRSQHINANAIDIKFCSRDARNRAKKVFRQLEKKYKTLGIGTYKSSSSVTVHLDFATRNYEI